jgi:membrane protein YqaA with SNARE-associated domain
MKKKRWEKEYDKLHFNTDLSKIDEKALSHYTDNIDELKLIENKGNWFKNTFLPKILYYIGIGVVIWILFIVLKEPIIGILQKNQHVWATFLHIQAQVDNRTYLGLFYAGILGTQIFLSLPVELIAIYYFTNDYNPLLIIFFAVLGMGLGLLFNYLLGIILGQKLLKFFLKSKYEKIEKKIQRYGGWILFGVTLIIAPADILVLIYGSVRYPFKKLYKIIFITLIIKFTLIYFLLGYITENIIPLFS